MPLTELLIEGAGDLGTTYSYAMGLNGPRIHPDVWVLLWNQKAWALAWRVEEAQD